MTSEVSGLRSGVDPGERARTRGRKWGITVILGLGLALLYSATDADLGSHDTLPATMLPLTLLRGEGLALDRFERLLREGGELPLYVTLSHGHIISRYPVAPALLILPLVAPQV